MDCMVTTALKSSLGRDLPLKSTQQPLFFDDVWVAAGAGGLNNLPSNDFSVDDLLDFSDKDFKDINSDIDEEKTSILFSSQHCSSNSGSFSETDDFGSLLAAQLAVPADDLESLEWLSQFVDDSRSELSFSCSAGGFNGKTGSYLKNSNQPTATAATAATAVVQETKAYSFPEPVPRKSRSVRTKRHRKAWSAPASLTTSSSSFSSSSSYGYPSSMLPFVFSNTVRDFEFSSVEKPPVIKKQKKKPSSDTGSGSNGSQGLRRCSHCQVQKTPQWRAGPLGPKTLCNACGVRYKSGRLFPEYRPACSPTYSQEVHSNIHRKVLEMRRKKDPVVVGPGEAGLSSMVPSY